MNDDQVEYHSLTPPQFVKAAQARDLAGHIKQALSKDLLDFLNWVSEELQDFPIESISPQDRQSLVQEYLELGPE